MKEYLIYGIGFLAQFLFMGRSIVQWFKSEQEGQVISPSLFWKLSLVASITMLTYGILRNDPAILIGQLLVYFIYVRNLQLKGAWKPIKLIFKLIILLMPAFILSYLFFGTSYNFDTFFRNTDISLTLMIWGITAQLIFISRFFYQWMYSEKYHESLLPLGFWIISILGSSLNFIYAIYRLDPVLFAAHSFGMFIYLRNILIHFNKKSLFQRIHIPILNRIFVNISNKIK